MPPRKDESTTEFWMRQIRNDVLDEAAKAADVFMSEEFSVGGCVTSKVAAHLVADKIRDMKNS